MRTPAPLQLVLHFPQTEAGQQVLCRSVSEVHADFVIGTIRKLNCPAKQKRALLQAVIDTVKGCYRPPGAREENSPRSGQDARLCVRNKCPEK